MHIQVCCNLSCAMNGARELVTHLCQYFNTKENQISTDGSVTISRVECLGACDQAPVAQINDKYIGPLNKNTVTSQIQKLLKEV